MGEVPWHKARLVSRDTKAPFPGTLLSLPQNFQAECECGRYRQGGLGKGGR